MILESFFIGSALSYIGPLRLTSPLLVRKNSPLGCETKILIVHLACGKLDQQVTCASPLVVQIRKFFVIAAEDINVFVDYTGAYEDGETLEDKTGGRLSLNKFFFDDR